MSKTQIENVVLAIILHKGQLAYGYLIVKCPGWENVFRISAWSNVSDVMLGI